MPMSKEVPAPNISDTFSADKSTVAGGVTSPNSVPRSSFFSSWD